MRLLAGPGRTDLVAVSLHRVLRRMPRPCICMLGGPLAVVNSLIACNLATATRGHPLPGHPRPETPFRPLAAIPFPATRGREPLSGHSRPSPSRPPAAGNPLPATRGHPLPGHPRPSC